MTLTQMPPHQEAPGASSNNITDKTTRNFGYWLRQFFDKKLARFLAGCVIAGAILATTLLILSGGHSATSTLTNTTGSPVIVPAPITPAPAAPSTPAMPSLEGSAPAAASASCPVVQTSGPYDVQGIADILIKQRALGFSGNPGCLQDAWSDPVAAQNDLARGATYLPVDHVTINPNNDDLSHVATVREYAADVVTSGVHYEVMVSFVQRGSQFRLAEFNIFRHTP